MKNLFLALLVFTSQLAFSQGITVLSNEKVPIPDSGKSYYPLLSPTGDYLVVSSDDMQGLKKYDLTTGELTTLTTDKGAGFGAQISSDGSTVVYRSREYKGRLRYTTLKSINVTNGKQEELIKPTRDLEGVSVKQGTVLAVENGKMKSKRVSGKKLSSTPPVVSVKEGQLYVTIGNSTQQISPFGTKVSYLWASVSPDATKLLFYVAGKGQTYVSDLDGRNAVALGTLRAPVWLGNDWVVGMFDKDNGEVITSSEIVAVATDGTNYTILTDSSMIALNPSASNDGKKIIYNTAEGDVYLMQVETNK